jgi:hypothetical protein
MIKSRRMRDLGHVAHMGEMKNAYQLLVRKPECKRPLGRPGYRWESNIRMDVREIGWKGVDWMLCSGQGAVVGFCEHGNEPFDSIKGR